MEYRLLTANFAIVTLYWTKFNTGITQNMDSFRNSLISHMFKLYGT